MVRTNIGADYIVMKCNGSGRAYKRGATKELTKVINTLADVEDEFLRLLFDDNIWMPYRMLYNEFHRLWRFEVQRLRAIGHEKYCTIQADYFEKTYKPIERHVESF